MSRPHQISKDLPCLGLDNRAFGNRQHKVFAMLAVTQATLARLTVLGFLVRSMVERQQSVDLWIHADDHVAAVSTITAVWATQRFKLFAVHGDTAVAPVSTARENSHAINKRCHFDLPLPTTMGPYVCSPVQTV